MKLLLKIVLTVFILFVLVSGAGLFYISRGLEAGEALTINSVDLAGLNDGAYNGAYNGGRWTNEVKVTIKDHRITSVEIVRDVLLPKPEITEELISRVLKEQKPGVDVVAGSTVTCKAYLKSIENALVQK